MSVIIQERSVGPRYILLYVACAAIVAAAITVGVVSCRPQPRASTEARSVVNDTAAATVVSGAVTYKQRIALPDGAVVRVAVQDVSLQDAPAKVMGEQVITANGKQIPITYAVRVPATSIDPRARYSVSARIEVDGELRFISTAHYGVMTMGNPTRQEIVLAPVP